MSDYFKNIFRKVLLENPYLPSPDFDQNTMDQGVQDFMDPETKMENPHAYDEEGITQHKDAIVQRFMDQIQGFANKLAPKQVETSTFGQIKSNVGSIFKAIDKVNTYAGAKLDQLNNEAPAVIAMAIALDPTKKAAFEKLHKELTEFTTSIEEVEGKFATLKAKIMDFIGDVRAPSDDGSQPVGESVKKKNKIVKESHGNMKPNIKKELYQNRNYGYDAPDLLGDWGWSDTFGRWGRTVQFSDGWKGFTWPKEVSRDRNNPPLS